MVLPIFVNRGLLAVDLYVQRFELTVFVFLAVIFNDDLAAAVKSVVGNFNHSCAAGVIADSYPSFFNVEFKIYRINGHKCGNRSYYYLT